MAQHVPPELDALFDDYERLRDAVLAYCAGTVDDQLVKAWHKALEDFANGRTTLEAIHEWIGANRKAILERASLPAFWPPIRTTDVAAVRVPPMTRKTRSDKGIPRHNKGKP